MSDCIILDAQAAVPEWRDCCDYLALLAKPLATRPCDHRKHFETSLAKLSSLHVDRSGAITD